MKRCFVVVCLLSLSSTLVCADSIGDNFNKGSMFVGVSPSISYDSSDWFGGAEAQFTFLVRDDLTMGGTLFMAIKPDTLYIRLAYVMSFILGYNPEAARGPAHRIGVKLEFLNVLANEYEGYGRIKPFYEFLYFITPHIAPYIEIAGTHAEWGGGPNTDFSIYWGMAPWIDALRTKFGISFYIPGRRSGE
jgi:hypothetical protein